MWIPTSGRTYHWVLLRYEADLTDAEWAVIAPPPPAGPAPCGRPAIWTMREILDAVLYVPRDD